MTLPNFLVIGTAKAGTTLLYDQLAEHPQVFMSPLKEPRFFALSYGNAFKFPARTLEAYEALFDGVTAETAVGEASPQYFYWPDAPQRIFETLPGVRLIVSLRQPADRVFSVYQLNIRNSGRNVGLPFAEAFRKDPVLRRGYHDDLARYLARFGRERVLVLLFEDLVRRGPETFRVVHEFLGVTPIGLSGVPPVSNPGGLPRNRLIHAMLQDRRLRHFGRRFAPKALMDAGRALRSRNLERQVLSPEDRAAVTEHFREDILRTEALIGRDLSAWLLPKAEAGPQAAGSMAVQ